MPSHCSEPGNEAKLAKYLRLGIMCNEDVVGNDGADELAKDGANLHIANDLFFMPLLTENEPPLLSKRCT